MAEASPNPNPSVRVASWFATLAATSSDGGSNDAKKVPEHAEILKEPLYPTHESHNYRLRMPLCSSNSSMSTDPQIRNMEKRIAQEARSDQKNLDHVIKDLKNAEKAHQKAIKVRVRL